MSPKNLSCATNQHDRVHVHSLPKKTVLVIFGVYSVHLHMRPPISENITCGVERSYVFILNNYDKGTLSRLFWAISNLKFLQIQDQRFLVKMMQVLGSLVFVPILRSVGSMSMTLSD